MNRRHFVQLCVASAGASVIVSKPVLAVCDTGPMAGSVYYTKDAQGRWQGKAGGHVPIIEIDKANGMVDVQITTPHEMKAYEHYIVKHVLLDKNYQFIEEHMFDPVKEVKPVSAYKLQGYSGTLYALSLCNKHDLWMNEIEV